MVSQILAVLIFLAMFILIITEIWERHLVTLICGALTLILVFGVAMQSPASIMEALNLHSFFTPGFWYQTVSKATGSAGINWETIVFIIGMMIMVEGMANAGFFRWLCMAIAKLVHYQVIPIFITFMALSFVLAMFIDSITVILFLAAVTIELSQLLKFNPISMILPEIFCANLGGCATMCGDPPNIIIGTSLGYSFSDFVANTGIIAVISLFAIIAYFYFIFRKELKTDALDAQNMTYPKPSEAITNKRAFIISCIIFLATVILLVTHSQTGLTVSSIGVFVAIAMLLTAGKNAGKLLKKIDYKTILFFIGLFVVVSGLEQTGILKILATFIDQISGGNVLVIVAIILWISAIASAFIDNIPFAATMLPVIQNLSVTQGIDLSILAWTLAIGTDIGGSATPIGASANVVGIATAAKEGHIIKWGRYCKAMVPATLLVLIIAMAVLYIRHF